MLRLESVAMSLRRRPGGAARPQSRPAPGRLRVPHGPERLGQDLAAAADRPGPDAVEWPVHPVRARRGEPRRDRAQRRCAGGSAWCSRTSACSTICRRSTTSPCRCASTAPGPGLATSRSAASSPRCWAGSAWPALTDAEPRHLSMGQRQLIAVARAVIVPARPAAVRRADHACRRQARAPADASARASCASSARTVVVSTHDDDLVDALSASDPAPRAAAG